jgi:uncharacterized protein (DUF885 family)
VLEFASYALLPLSSCIQPKLPPENPPSSSAAATAENPAAVEGVSDPALRGLLNEHWERTMQRSPVWATMLGDHRWDDKLGDGSQDAREAARADSIRWRDAAVALKGTLTSNDEATRQLFVQKLSTGIALDSCHFDTWSFSPRSNPLGQISGVAELHPVLTPEDGKNLVSRIEAFSKVIDTDIQNLRIGAEENRFANAASTALVVEMFEKELASPLVDSPLMLPGKTEHPNWTAEEEAAFQKELKEAVEGSARPALSRYLDLIKAEILPNARIDGEGGLVHLPGGDTCYSALVSKYTTLPITAEDLHRTGLAELEGIHADMRALGQELFGTEDLQAIFERLRTDPSLYFKGEQEVQDKAEDALAAAEAAMSGHFGRLPRAECIVKQVPDYEAPYTTIAYYRPPPGNGEKPGVYYVNTYAPETRPRYEAEVLAFHESIPGHHLQISIAQELPGLPAFRRHMGMTAFVEGWGLYSERLADEMGLYSGPLDRMGMLGFDSWRAARLVVDTGIHANGWSRAEAERFMKENTPLAENNIRNEVDRYINTPGQALAYKTGQLEILRLRAIAEERLGDAFVLSEFHDAVLGGGAVTLPMLERQVELWMGSL